MDTASTVTEMQTDQNASVTDSEVARANTKSESTTDTPKIEQRDGKFFLNGQRIYSRDDTNKIAANAKNEALNSFLRELEVDSLENVKDVIKTLKTAPLTEDGSHTLDVKALKQAVAKREATVDELQKTVSQLKTELLLKDHLTNLYGAMPGGWSQEQRSAVVDLMKARNMFAIEGNSFQLRNGDEFFTVDGERPDYATAVEAVGRTLGLNFGKKGVNVVNAESSIDSDGPVTNKAVDDARLNSDTEYRNAYMQIRQYQPSLSRSDITHQQVVKQLEKTRKLRGLATTR
jgi:hypothetical protein